MGWLYLGGLSTVPGGAMKRAGAPPEPAASLKHRAAKEVRPVPPSQPALRPGLLESPAEYGTLHRRPTVSNAKCGGPLPSPDHSTVAPWEKARQPPFDPGPKRPRTRARTPLLTSLPLPACHLAQRRPFAPAPWSAKWAGNSRPQKKKKKRPSAASTPRCPLTRRPEHNRPPPHREAEEGPAARLTL